MVNSFPGLMAHWQRLIELDSALCLHCNRVGTWRNVERLFGIVSRLGDGVFWYTLMILLLLHRGTEALPVVGQMLITGTIGLTIYKWLKTKTTRPRPFTRNQQIRISVAPLDQYSFPSGHTLHAVGFSAVAVSHYPALGWVLLPFTLLVALSRLVLGLHYPSDVLAGATLGVSLAVLVQSLY